MGNVPPLTLQFQSMSSHPVIMSLVLRQLFTVFCRGWVAHAHWARNSALIPVLTCLFSLAGWPPGSVMRNGISLRE